MNYKQPDNNLQINIIQYQSIIRYDLKVYRQLTLTRKCLISFQPRTQACQLFQASAVPVLTCPSFDPPSRSSSFKFGFRLFTESNMEYIGSQKTLGFFGLSINRLTLLAGLLKGIFHYKSFNVRIFKWD